MAWNLIRQSKHFRDNKHPLQFEFAAMVLAAVASAFERKTLDASMLSLEEIATILALDVETNIHYGALVEQLRRFPREDVVDVLTRRIEEAADTFGGLTLARLMGELGWPEFIQPLIGCIGESRDSLLCEVADEALSYIGEPAAKALMAQWDTLDDTQKIYVRGVIASAGGESLTDFALRRFDDMFKEDVESWSELALGSPDPRLIERLRPELRRRQHPIDLTYYRLCRLLDVDGPKLSETHERILRKRKQQEEALAKFESGEIFDEPRTSLNLALRCSECGAVNDYEVKSVVMGDFGKHEKPLIADEFPCLSCGALAEFDIPAESHMAIAAEFMFASLAHKPGEEYSGPLRINEQMQWSDGKLQSIPSIYVYLQERVRTKPNDWLSWFRLGRVMWHISRPKAALACIEKARAGNPLLLEAIINHAGMLMRTNQEAAALDVLCGALANHGGWQTISRHLDEKRLEFVELFNELRYKLGRVDLPVLGSEFFGRASKVGRNAPCPCGSGKKYKKCCGLGRS